MHYTQAYTVSLRVITLPVVEIQETMTAHALFSLQDVRLISEKAEVSSLRTCFYTFTYRRFKTDSNSRICRFSDESRTNTCFDVTSGLIHTLGFKKTKRPVNDAHCSSGFITA